MKAKISFALTALTLLLCLFSTLTFAGISKAPVPSHHISMSFDLESGTLHATSRIVIPPEVPLSLFTGSLNVTGAVLEPADKTPVALKQISPGHFRITASPIPQTIYLSWRLRPSSHRDRDNLISEEGITLAGFWHPTAEREMTYSLDATLPRGFTGISEAEEITTVHSKHAARTTTRFDHPLTNIHFIAGPYEVIQRRHGNIELSAYFFKEDSSLADGYLDKTAQYIDLYQELIGPYPYTRYAVVENRLPTGYGMPTFTLLGQAVVRLPFIKDTSLGHEVLHSWFGNSVFVSTAGGNWSEGLTTYLADHLYKERQGLGSAYRKNQLLRYRTGLGGREGQPLSRFRNAGRDHQHSRKIRAVGYDKASMVFHMLRRSIGDQAFFAGLKSFYRDNRFKTAGWQELIQAFSAHTTVELSSFFNQWLERTDTPRVSAKHIKIQQKAGKSIISFDLTQHTETPYLLNLNLEIETMTGSLNRTITTREQAHPVTLTTDTLPLRLIIDPDYDTLRTLVAEELPPIWSAFLGSGQKNILISRTEAANYQALLEAMQQLGATVSFEETVAGSSLQQGDWLLAGDSKQRRALFADVIGEQAGFRLSVIKNPLNPDTVLVTADSASAEETIATARKLRHYGKYSTLHFNRGRIAGKEISPSENGVHYKLLEPPSGISTAPAMSFSEIMEHLRKSRVIYIGETHTDYGAHLLQLQIIQALHAAGEKLMIGMEMFPRSSQGALDDYINGTVDSEKHFLKESNYFTVWGFDYRLYRDIIAFAKEKNIPLVGLNLDKEITRTMFRTGATDSLTEDQRKSIPADRDLNLPGYSERLRPVFGQHASPHANSGFAGFIQAQALWDETMAETIAGYLTRHPDTKMVVIAGNGHVHRTSGIPPRVLRRLPGTPQQVVLPQPLSGSLINSRVAGDYLIPTAAMSIDPAGKIGVVLSEREENTVRIDRISPHGKAADGGLRDGDIILAINGVDITAVSDLKFALLESAPGETIDLEIEREGVQRTVQVELSGMSSMMMPPGHPQVKQGKK